ncbi:uncharacterized protein [Dermacentor albipictus]|uniref:uncharacterized protein isoform X2 n=1 Tax=Dermacentor albipictus TaxID=60249 RepID=UPI0038FBEB62
MLVPSPKRVGSRSLLANRTPRIKQTCNTVTNPQIELLSLQRMDMPGKALLASSIVIDGSLCVLFIHTSNDVTRLLWALYSARHYSSPPSHSAEVRKHRLGVRQKGAATRKLPESCCNAACVGAVTKSSRPRPHLNAAAVWPPFRELGNHAATIWGISLPGSLRAAGEFTPGSSRMRGGCSDARPRLL